jgi:hypothetical protein
MVLLDGEEDGHDQGEERDASMRPAATIMAPRMSPAALLAGVPSMAAAAGGVGRTTDDGQAGADAGGEVCDGLGIHSRLILL